MVFTVDIKLRLDPPRLPPVTRTTLPVTPKMLLQSVLMVKTCTLLYR